MAHTPPEGWTTGRCPAVVSTRTSPTGDQVVTALAAATGATLATLTLPSPAGDPVAAYAADGLLPPAGSWAHHALTTLIRLGRPDLAAHQLGYTTGRRWWPWPDGSWRAPATPLGRRHLVTAGPLAPHTRDIGVITVREYPSGVVAVDTLVDPITPAPGDTRALDTALDRLGYTVRYGAWQQLPGGVWYAPARPGRLAEQDWHRRARARVTRDVAVRAPAMPGTRVLRAGEELVVCQHGHAGREIDRGVWWTSGDGDAAYILDADTLDLIEVLEESPPMRTSRAGC